MPAACSAIVCLAVWLAMGVRSAIDKTQAAIYSSERICRHRLRALDGQGTVSVAGAVLDLVIVTAGNIVGGALLVAGVYWLAYLRGGQSSK